MDSKRRLQLACLYAGFFAGLGLVTAAVLEAGIRMFVPEKHWRIQVAEKDCQPDALLGWMHKTNTSVEKRGIGGDIIRFRTNPDGLQPASARPERDPNRHRIMLFGDSTVVGRAVPEHQRLGPELERALASRGLGCEVICAGVAGYATDQSLLLMRRLLPRYRPDLVIHMASPTDYHENGRDIMYGLPKPRFTVGPDGELILHEPSLDQILSIWNATNRPRFRSTLGNSALYRLARPGFQHLCEALGLRQKTVRRREDPESPESLLSKADWNLYDSLIGAMKKACKQNGADLLLTQHPSVEEVWSDAEPESRRYSIQHRLELTARKTAAGFCPVISFFLQRRSEGPFHLLPEDKHCNAKGYEVTARCLADHLAANPSPLRRNSGDRPVTSPQTHIDR